MVTLPQTLTIYFEPIDDGNLANIEIVPETQISQVEIEQLLIWVTGDVIEANESQGIYSELTSEIIDEIEGDPADEISAEELDQILDDDLEHPYPHDPEE